MEVKIKKLYEDVQIPQYATKGSAGFDLVVHNFQKLYKSTDPANLSLDITGATEVTLTPGSRLLVGSGFSIELPEEYELQIRSRSGKALKEGLVVLNSPGTIDEDYRGEVGAILCNTSPYNVLICLGDKVAQAVLNKVEQIQWSEVEVLTETDRGAGGFGSTDSRRVTPNSQQY